MAAAAQWLVLAYGLVAGELIGWFIVGELMPSLDAGSVLDGVATVPAIAGMLLVQPFIAMYRLMLYVDVRTREEGWDLQVELRALRLAGEP